MGSGVTYIFQNGKVYALRAGKVIGSASEVNDELEKLSWDGPDPGYSHHPEHMQMGGPEPTEMPPPPDGIGSNQCPECGAPLDQSTGICPQCGYDAISNDPVGGMQHSYPQDGDDGSNDNFRLPLASITTPNGLKGRVLGKVAGLWGDEVTVRLENGRVVRLPVSKEMKFASAKVASQEGTPINRLEARLASSVDGTRPSLVARRDELVAIQQFARTLIANGVSHKDSEELDRIVVTAELEMGEVDGAIDHLDDASTQAYQPPAPFSMGVADEAAASMGGSDASWLDETVNNMIADAEATDFQKLMDEGPEAFAADLPDAAVADQGVVRQMASNHIRTKTAGIDPEIRDPYVQTFVTRVEECRRAELNTRKQATKKEAAAEEAQHTDLPDDAIFL